MEFLSGEKKKLKITEGSTGILYIKNGDIFIPNYDVDKTRQITLRILNLKNSSGERLCDSYKYDGFNWGSVIIADLMWGLIYPYILYESYLKKIAESNVVVELPSNGRFRIAYSLLFKADAMQLESGEASKIIRKIPGVAKLVNELIYKNNLNYLDNDVVFDVLTDNNYRTIQIENTLDELGIKWSRALAGNHSLMKITGNFNGIIKHYFWDNKKIISHDFDLSSFKCDEILKDYVENAINEIERRISRGIHSYKIHLKSLRMHKPRLFLSMDEVNSRVFSLLYACRKLGIPTIGFEHGAYANRHFPHTQIGLKGFNYDWFDKILVWGQYQMDKLMQNKNLLNTKISVFANKHKNFPYEKLGKKQKKKQSLNILFPYEFLANTYEVGKYMNKLIDLGHNIYFKSRDDAKPEEALKAYHLKQGYAKQLIITENVNNDLLRKIDVIMGTQTSYLYELMPYQIPIFFPKTEFTLMDDMVDEGLAKKITLDELESLPELVFNYEFRGKAPEYYFTVDSLKEKMFDLLNSYKITMNNKKVKVCKT